MEYCNMQPTTIPSANIRKAVNQNANTAYWIFDRGAQVQFKVNSPHFKARAGGMHDPVIGMSRNRFEDLSAQMVSVQDTVMGLVEYFMEGASLEIKPEISTLVYDRIYAHMEAHLKAMSTRKSYDIGDTFSVFEQLVDFACVIYPTVLGYKEVNKLPTVTTADPFANMMYARPNFMTSFNRDTSQAAVVNDTLQSEIKVSPLVDMLERMRMYYNGGMGWN